jgi:hypothetical protein
MQQETVHRLHSSGLASAPDALLAAAALRRVFAILMPLEAEGDLRLTLSAEENNFLKVLIVIVLPSRVVRLRRKDHSIALLDGASRFNLVHEALFAVEGITDHTSHRGLYCLPFFDGVKGVCRKSVVIHLSQSASRRKRPEIGQFANFIVLPIKPSLYIDRIVRPTC